MMPSLFALYQLTVHLQLCMSFQEAQAKKEITAEYILKEKTVLLALVTPGPVDTKKTG